MENVEVGYGEMTKKAGWNKKLRQKGCRNGEWSRAGNGELLLENNPNL